MPKIKRLWKDEELIGMHNTVSALRKMRTAAVAKPTFALRLRRTFNHLVGGNEQIYQQQEALSHAEELADAASDFFAAKLTKTNHGKTEFEKWMDLFYDSRRQYRLYGNTTYARTTLREVVGSSVIARLRDVHIDPDYMLHWDLLRNNNLGADSIEELLDQDIGVFAPLSGDYLMASVYSRYLQCTRGRTFPVRAAALSRDLSEILLPLGPDGLPFQNQTAIGVYIDTTQTGNTGLALYRKLLSSYPRKTVHIPRREKTPFVRSEKMERYWGEAK